LPYRFVEDAPTADVGFIATGKTLEECFTAAAAATLAAMLGNPESLDREQRLPLSVVGDSKELALLKMLEEMIFYKDARSLFLRICDVRIETKGESCRVEATLEGERIDPTRHELANDVKAVTMHRLSVRQTGDGWEASVVLDV
jgi:SHS2 domain-containing protein